MNEQLLWFLQACKNSSNISRKINKSNQYDKPSEELSIFEKKKLRYHLGYARLLIIKNILHENIFLKK